jgi:hypothetical protein
MLLVQPTHMPMFEQEASGSKVHCGIPRLKASKGRRCSRDRRTCTSHAVAPAYSTRTTP